MSASRSLRLLVLALLLSPGLPGCRSPAADGPLRVVLIVLDTTRADAVGAGAGAASVTPHLDRLAAEGVRYTHARTTSAWTLPSHASLFTGLQVSGHGAHWDHRRLAGSLTTLAEHLQPTHETAGFSENPHIIRDLGFAQGFDHFEETWRLQRVFGSDHDTVDRVEGWLEERDPGRPFLLFVNLMTAHLPYTPLPSWQRRELPEGSDPAVVERMRAFGEREARRFMAGALALDEAELAVLRALYRAEVAQLDAQVGRLLAALRRHVAPERTLVVVVGDHGENIGEHGMMEHQLCLYETLLRVPLLLHLPGHFEGGEQRAAPVQLTDVLPTALEAVGVEIPADAALHGVSLLGGDPPPERPVRAEVRAGDENRLLFERARPGFDFDRFDRHLWSLQRGNLKVIVSDRGEVELYDLASDPGETRDLSASRPASARRLMAEIVRDPPPGGVPGDAEPAIDEETRSMLRELGYIE